MRALKTSKGGISALFLLLLAAVFLVSLVAVLLLGARVYSGIQARSEAGYDGRTCLSYIQTQLRRADRAGAIEVGVIGEDTPALLLSETYEGTVYVTAIYHHEGWVMELFAEEGLGLGAEAGTPVLEAPDLCFAQEDGLIRITSGDAQMAYAPRSQEVAP